MGSGADATLQDNQGRRAAAFVADFKKQTTKAAVAAGKARDSVGPEGTVSPEGDNAGSLVQLLVEAEVGSVERQHARWLLRSEKQARADRV